MSGWQDPNLRPSAPKKRAISYDDIKKIIEFNTEEHSNLHEAQNIFLFSFYNMGMNFIDIAHLKWSNVTKDRVHYTRQKTKKQFTIKILQPVRDILNYYEQFKEEHDYIFPIFTDFHQTAKQKKHARKRH